MRTDRKRRALQIGAALLCLGALAACRASTTSSEVGVHVDGYDIFPTDAHIKDCIPPATNKYIGIGDKSYIYPAGQRTFTFDSKGGSDYPPIQIVSSDNVTLTLTGVVTFYLNQDCNTLKAFHANIGSKVWGGKHAYVNDGFEGWTNMLDVYMGKPLQNALTDVGNNFGYLDLYTKASVRQGIESKITADLAAKVKELTGGDYFQKFSILLNKPEAPDSIVSALTDNQAAIQENNAQKNKNATAITSFQQLQQCKQLGLSEQTCFELYAVNKGGISVVPVPTGSSVNINAGGAPAPQASSTP